VPEGRGHHVLDSTLFAVGELHFCLFLAYARALAAERALVFRTLARCLATNRTGLWRLLFTLAWVIAALLARFRFQRLAVPLRIVEVQIGLHEVVDGEVVLAVVKPRAAPDDLLELDDRINWPLSGRCCTRSRLLSIS
jgi:hypothetical protein